ncbi:TetR/AcrR family transcriptional regulator, partial [Caulobacter sp. B11]|uniref:TetR/AcrR family transcriptional regulator n=1 Tax=Caulobacter sp. B11 TaxID=2048899 RepID=UPI001F3D7EAA
MEAVVELAATRNPAEITTGQIAERMQLTQGALFRHFPTKDAVWDAVMVWTADQLTQRLDQAEARGLSPLLALE